MSTKHARDAATEPSHTPPGRVIAVIQARLGSTRLPGKVLLPILEKPMLHHQIARARRARTVDEIVVATSDHAEDRAIMEAARQAGVSAYAGDEVDVLDRIYRAASAHGADVVVRLTGDCPLIDPAIIDRFVSYFVSHRATVDYVGVGPSYPEGVDVEVLSFSALHKAWTDATLAYEREHVTMHVWQSGRFRTQRLEYETDLSGMRWTVDERRDLEVVTTIYENLFPRYGYDFGVEEILAFLKTRPGLIQMNDQIIRNEGLLKSLEKERKALVKHRVAGTPKSEALWATAKDLIPSGTQTFSKGPSQYVDGFAPKYIVRGEGSHVWDVDGNEYIDFPMALGAIVLGHAYPATIAAIVEQLKSGISHTLMHPIEVEVASLLRSLIPCAEMVRFAKGGSDATTGAIRVARAITGRDKIAHCGYHGWHDWYLASTNRRRGVPQTAVEQQHAFAYNDAASLERLFAAHPGQIGAVIMEPYGATLPAEGFLSQVKEIAHRNGALLIYDEIASGFRFTIGGVHQHFGVDPDLACFGKAIGNGMPLAALVGRAEYMRVLDEVFFSSTFGGDTLALAAARSTIVEMQTFNVIPHLWELGGRLQAGFSRLISDLELGHVIRVTGMGPRIFATFQATESFPALLVKSLFQQEVLRRGVLFNGTHCVCFSHTIQDIEATLGAYHEALEILGHAIHKGDVASRLEGRPIQPPFRSHN